MDPLNLQKHPRWVGCFALRNARERLPKLRFEPDRRAAAADPNGTRCNFNTFVGRFASSPPNQDFALRATAGKPIKGARTGAISVRRPRVIQPGVGIPMAVFGPSCTQRLRKGHLGHSLLKNFRYPAYKRGMPPHFHRFEGAEMPGVDLVSNLRAALERRRITFKAAARMCGRSPDTIQRIFQGRTAKLDAQDILAIASAVAEERSDPTERDRFLFEVFEIGNKTSIQHADLDRRIVRLERLSLPQPTCLWFDESGVATRHPRTDLAGLAYEILKMRPGREDIVAFACRNLGYVGLSLDAVGTLRLYYEPNAASRQALTAVRDWLLEHSDGVRRVLRNRSAINEAVDLPESETPSDTIAALGRRILAATPLPPSEWLVERRRIDEMPDPLRDTLRLAHAGSSPMTGLAAANKLRAAHVYAVIDGEAVSLQMSSAHDLPTKHYVGRRVLDRPTDRDYAALVDRHLTESLRENSATLYKLSLRIGGNRRNYWRLALPDRDSGIVVSAPWETPENPR